MLPSDRVSAAPLAGADAASKGRPGQERRASAATTSRESCRGKPEYPSREARSGRQWAQPRPRSPAAETGRYVVFPCFWRGQGVSVAQGHQESARGRDEDHAPGSNTAGVRPECHRGLPSAAEAVQRTTVHIARRRSRDAGVHQIEERTERCKSPPARRDHRVVRLEQGAAIRDERVGSLLPGATAPATKWHLRMNHKGGPTVLNVELDPMRKRSTITHEAAVRIGLP